jgi:cell division protein FtsL
MDTTANFKLLIIVFTIALLILGVTIISLFSRVIKLKNELLIKE